ncbi:DUF6932 family protein [Rhodococcus rhodochrous]|uniref:DUF6932 family protein n=1 Tax=Rhodococcus rhodochrous TaxID=1829 RepID=UPI0012FE4C82|nr:hypothetical protein [Rhodococcus rhodochrous]
MGAVTIPDFVAGPDGYSVLPPGRWTCTTDDFKARFVQGLPDAPRRKQIIEDLEEYQRQQQACGLVVTSYWIDGSFTSAKLNPGDIDVTAIIDGAASSPTGNAHHWINPGSQWKSIPHPDVGRTLLVDGFAVVKVPDGHPAMSDYQQMRGYWDDWWQRCRGTGEAESKGYVEVRM